MSPDDDLEDVRPSPSAEPDLDELAAERFLASLRPGAPASPADVPAGFEGVDALLRSASAPASEAELAGLRSALTMFAQERPAAAARGSRRGRRFAIGGIAAAVFVTGGIGAAYAGWRVILLVAGRDIRILTLDSTQLRHLTLDPHNDYQPIG